MQEFFSQKKKKVVLLLPMPGLFVCFLKYMPHFVDKCFYRLEALCYLSKARTLTLNIMEIIYGSMFTKTGVFEVTIFYISSLFFKCIKSPTLDLR